MLALTLAVPAFALEESDVEAAVSSSSREAVTGNVLVWFLCAVGFLKVSQKIDSFMASIGVNVGHTGGSMLGDVVVAFKGVSLAAGAAGKVVGNFADRAASHTGGSSAPGSPGFLQGGLAGVVNRSFYNGAYKSATGTGSGGVGGMAFRASMTKGGDVANNVISRIATGRSGAGDVMSGNMAADALMSYMGYTALGEGAADIPSFSNVEIGGGHITGTETSEEEPAGRSFAMYSTEQYMEPKREYTTVTTVDGTKWYKQYAQDVVEKTPYQNPDGGISYRESLIRRLPDPPRRKDKV